MRFDLGPPRADPRVTVTTAGAAFVARVMRLWDQQMDTRAISLTMMERESVVAWAVRVGREERR